MGWPNDMPDESYVRQMVEDMHHAIQSLEKALFRGNNGTEGLLTELSHVKRTATDNAEAIKGLGESIKALSKKLDAKPQVDGSTDMKFWGKVTGLAAGVFGVIEIAIRIASQIIGG